MRGIGLGLIIGAASLLASTAQAEPAVLFVPDEDVELFPLGIGECSGQGGQDNSALGCTDVDEVVGVPAHPAALALRGDLMMALDPYDVHIADERPPPYLPYTMLLPTGTSEPRTESFTCTLGGINCAARKRNDIARVLDSTQNCMFSDLLLASLYGFGRISGLEGVGNPVDAMNYPPDYSMGSPVFVDGCSPIVNQMGFNEEGMPVDLPLECTSLDHVGCMAGQQNGHADLLAIYGSRVVDLDPPVLSNLMPGDGAFLRQFDDLVVDVDISDADPVVGGRWSIFAPELEDAGIEGGLLTICTNDVCFVNFDDANPLKATESDWSFTLSGLPPAVYEITFEASDFHGNVAQPVVQFVYVGIEPPGNSEGSGDEVGEEEDDGVFTTGNTSVSTTSPGSSPDDSGGVGADSASASDSDSDTDSDGPEQNGDGLIDHGCACRSTPSSGWGMWMMVLVGGTLRRRRRRRG